MFKLTSTQNDRASCLISTQHDTTRCMLLGFHVMFAKRNMTRHSACFWDLNTICFAKRNMTQYGACCWDLNMTRSPPLAMRQELPRCSFKHANSCLMYQFLST